MNTSETSPAERNKMRFQARNSLHPPQKSDFLYNTLAERRKSQRSQLEMLPPERDADNRDAKQDTQPYVGQGNPYASA